MSRDGGAGSGVSATSFGFIDVDKIRRESKKVSYIDICVNG